MKKIRMGIVIGQLSHGGAERQSVLLARGLKKYSHYEPVLFCLSSNIEPHGLSLDELGLEYYFFPYKNRNYFQKLLWLVINVHKVKCHFLYGILHVGSIMGGIAASILRIPYITSIRSANVALPAYMRYLSRYLSQRADRVIANSHSCIYSLRNDIGVTTEATIIMNGVEYFMDEFLNSQAQDIKKELGLPSDALTIGTVAVLKSEKRPEFFIEMCLSVLNANHLAYFVWVGDGPLRQEAIQIINSLPSELSSHFKFIGSRINVWDYLMSFDLFVLTSLYEGMPNALLEAMAVGLPCVATNVMGTMDVLTSSEKEIGILASSSDPLIFAGTVLELLADPARMNEIGRLAREHIRVNYSLEKMVMAHCDVFDDILGLK